MGVGRVFKSGLLDFTSFNHSVSDRGAAFSGFYIGKIGEWNRHHLNMKVNTVEKGATYSGYVTLDEVSAARASSIGVVMIATRTRVHGSYQHKVGRKLNRILCSGKSHDAVFQRLSHNFQS